MARRSGLFARYRKASVLIILIAVSIVMLLLSTRSLAGLPERVGMSIAAVFQSALDYVAVFASDTVTSIPELRRLKEDYAQAIAKLEEYQNIERGLSETRAENIRLKEQLGFATDDTMKKMAAKIIAKDPENVHTTIIVNKGAKDGVKKNFPVIAYQGGVQGLVGRVTEVGRNSSIVLPLYDPSSNIAARLERGRYEGLVTGTGEPDQPLILQYVKKLAQDDIQFGDLVVTSGMWQTYPADIAIGRIKERIQAEYKTSIEYDIDPVLDFSRLEYVFIIFQSQGGLE
jgi:rod shape-determining protein MreC